MNDVKLVSTVTYGIETPFFLSTMKLLSRAHLNIEDPPHDTEIQVMKCVTTLSFTHNSLECSGILRFVVFKIVRTCLRIDKGSQCVIRCAHMFLIIMI